MQVFMDMVNDKFEEEYPNLSKQIPRDDIKKIADKNFNNNIKGIEKYFDVAAKQKEKNKIEHENKKELAKLAFEKIDNGEDFNMNNDVDKRYVRVLKDACIISQQYKLAADIRDIEQTTSGIILLPPEIFEKLDIIRDAMAQSEYVPSDRFSLELERKAVVLKEIKETGLINYSYQRYIPNISEREPEAKLGREIT